MQNFRCRSIKPGISRWFDVKAETYGDAIQLIHSAYVPNISSNLGVSNGAIKSIAYRKEDEDGSVEGIYFSLIEVDGLGEFVSRIYYKGIRRVGKLKINLPTIDDIAKILDWKHPSEDLLNEGWANESKNYTNYNGDIII